MSTAIVYLIPAPLDEAGIDVMQPGILQAIRSCQVIFAENERTTRRYFKKLDPSIIIDHFEWVTIHNAEEAVQQQLVQHLKAGKVIGIVSEAGCPGIADPGQLLVATAHRYGATVKPLTGPSSIVLALMASGLNGQQFTFNGYLPVDAVQRRKKLQQLEETSARQQTTQVFIETPYRNNQLLEAIITSCKQSTRLCVAVNLTGQGEWVVTRTLGEWSKMKPELHKQQVVFCMLAQR